MKKVLFSILAGLFVSFVFSGCSGSKGYKGESEDLPLTMDETYTKECGSCHWDYNPALMPTRSWMAMMDNLDSHFGDNAELKPEVKEKIRNYLILHSAEHANAKLSRKIVEDNWENTPDRISQMSYIKRKHHDLSDDVFQRKEIKSRANCTACHQSAKEGVFEEDDVKVPES